MLITHTARELRDALTEYLEEGESVALVPTMGALHAGHVALVELGCELADRVVASVFVNPTQFDDPRDLERYPRQPERDAELLESAGADLLFLPAREVIYPPGDATRVEMAGPAEGLEGAHRPGHFRGVATVVLRLLNLVQPDFAIFGQKDAQQLAVVRRMVADLHVPVQIVAHPTVRETDGLAMSSRNALLTPEDRAAAPVLYRALSAARDLVAAGERDADALRAAMRRVLAAEPRAEVEYAEVVDGATFRPLDRLPGRPLDHLPAGARVVLPMAVRIGAVRLIDNLVLELDGDSQR